MSAPTDSFTRCLGLVFVIASLRSPLRGSTRFAVLAVSLCSALHLSFLIPAQAGSSANYALAPDAIDHGGLRGTSANYTLNASAMPGGEGTSTNYTSRTGFAGQLADAIATAIDIFASPLTVNEGGARQLGGTLIFDDLSTSPLDANSITWSVQSGPIASINSGGLATATTVYEDTAAVVQGAYQAFTDTLNLTVLNTLPDNFSTYAADGIDDDWQVLHFNLPPNANAAPGADPDHDGQDNLLEFFAGVTPTDAASRFLIDIAPVPGQPAHQAISFSPRFATRTYTVQSSTTLLGGSWSPLSSFTSSDNALMRTVTDLSAAGPWKFYRVHITKP